MKRISAFIIIKIRIKIKIKIIIKIRILFLYFLFFLTRILIKLRDRIIIIIVIIVAPRTHLIYFVIKCANYCMTGLGYTWPIRQTTKRWTKFCLQGRTRSVPYKPISTVNPVTLPPFKARFYTSRWSSAPQRRRTLSAEDFALMHGL